MVLNNNIKVYSPIIEAVKTNPNIKNIYIYSWYDFPMYSEFHDSGIKIEHELCEHMHKLFTEKGY